MEIVDDNHHRNKIKKIFASVYLYTREIIYDIRTYSGKGKKFVEADAQGKEVRLVALLGLRRA